MDITVLDTNLNVVGLLDTYSSIIWNDRYFGFGDFEIYLPVDSLTYYLLQENFYLKQKGSNKPMIIERKVVQASPDIRDQLGDQLIVTGRSLESLLYRRILWSTQILKGSFQTVIETMLNEAAITPWLPDRIIPNLIFEQSTDPEILAATLEVNQTGGYLYDIIYNSCFAEDIGFEITLTEDNKFKFRLYKGVDRSYTQLTNPYVIFSPSYDNTLGSEYISDIRDLKTVTHVYGKDYDENQVNDVIVEAPEGAGSGINRRETSTDVRNLPDVVDGVALSQADYLGQLSQKGKEHLSQMTHIRNFEGRIDPVGTFVYGSDFFLGDIVQVADAYGNEGTSRVTEFIQVESAEGFDAYPTFTTIPEG